MSAEMRRFSHDPIVDKALLEEVPSSHVYPVDVMNWAFMRYLETGNENYAHWTYLGSRSVYFFEKDGEYRLPRDKEEDHIKNCAKRILEIEPKSFGHAIKLIQEGAMLVNPLSLNKPNGEDGQTLEGTIGIVTEEVEGGIIRENDREEALRLLARLGERKRNVLEKRFGIGYERSYTLDEIGQEIGVTRERIRQIEAEALKDLRNFLTTEKS